MMDDHDAVMIVTVMHHDDLAMIPVVIVIADVDGYAFLRHHHRLVAHCRSGQSRRAQERERARD
jgi:hypothetical protein